MIKTGILGTRAEKLATKFLQAKGLLVKQHNYHCRHGEIDIVMQDKDYLVFVEVRYRKWQDFGGALASIDQRKQNKLRRSAEHYLIRFKKTDCPCRFDILCLSGSIDKPEFHWVKNAF